MSRVKSRRIRSLFLFVMSIIFFSFLSSPIFLSLFLSLSLINLVSSMRRRFDDDSDKILLSDSKYLSKYCPKIPEKSEVDFLFSCFLNMVLADDDMYNNDRRGLQACVSFFSSFFFC